MDEYIGYAVDNFNIKQYFILSSQNINISLQYNEMCVFNNHWHLNKKFRSHIKAGINFYLILRILRLNYVIHLNFSSGHTFLLVLLETKTSLWWTSLICSCPEHKAKCNCNILRALLKGQTWPHVRNSQRETLRCASNKTFVFLARGEWIRLIS